MKKIGCMILLLCFLSVLEIQAQINGDSLLNVLNTQKTTAEEQLRIYNQLLSFYKHKNVRTSLFYAQKGLELAKKEKNKDEIYWFTIDVGTNYGILGIIDTAMIYLNQALVLVDETKNSHKNKAWIYGNMGNLYYRKNDKTKALECFVKAKGIADDTGDKALQLNALISIASLNRSLYNLDKAVDYYSQANILAEELKDSIAICDCYYGIASIFMDRHEHKNSLEYKLRLIDISKAIGSEHHELLGLLALARSYNSNELKEYDKALKYINQADSIANIYGDPRFIISAKELKSHIYCSFGRYKEAETLALEALKMDSLESGITKRNTLSHLVTIYILLGQKEKAIDYFVEYSNVIDQYNEKSFHDSMVEQETKYETEKKEIRIAALEDERRLYIKLGVAIVVALLLGIGLLFYRHFSKRKMAEQQIKQLEQEKELIAFRATLDAEQAEQEIIARDLHDGVGAMLSVVKNNLMVLKQANLILETKEADYLNKGLLGLDESIVELRRVAHHLMPEILIKKGLAIALNDFCHSIPNAEFHFMGQDRRFDSMKELVLYRCSYELVNNALKHAKASHIDVHLNMDQETVSLSVVDDGCGFDSQTTTRGMGLNNLYTRLSAFGGNIDIYSEIGKGTEVNVELNI